MTEVLIIDDDEQICMLLSRVFTRMGHTTSYRLGLKDGLFKIFSDPVDIVFLDVNLPDGNGLDAIETIRQHPFAPEIIIITADEDADGAELAIRARAWDYIAKTESHKHFVFALERASEYRKQKQAIRQKPVIHRESIIGESKAISACLDTVLKTSGNDLPVLITGETGTGKELFSRAIHENSARALAEFVVVDCASLPEHLVESTLFGHVKGAFTGADTEKTGLMKFADNGTLFLDEVGELPMGIQQKFLRALQEKKFRPIGSKNEAASDFRLICATNRDLETMVKQGKFRQDLFFRIFSMNIHLPPLKDRENDLSILAHHHITHRQKSSPKKSCTMSPEFLEELQLYEWPGNVRELINTIGMVCSEADDNTILFPHHLPEHIRAFNIRQKINGHKNKRPKSHTQSQLAQTSGLIHPLKDHIERVKYEYLQKLITVTNGNIKECCRISGLSRGHLYRLIQQHSIKVS